jgi:hypothetical protein
VSNEPIISFRGKVELRRNAFSPLGLTLVGESADQVNEKAYVSFVMTPPLDLPRELHDVLVHRIDADHFQLTSLERDWLLSATGVHLHRDVSAVFYKAVPPRPVPLSKRIMWRLIVGLADTPIGRALTSRRGTKS